MINIKNTTKNCSRDYWPKFPPLPVTNVFFLRSHRHPIHDVLLEEFLNSLMVRNCPDTLRKMRFYNTGGSRGTGRRRLGRWEFYPMFTLFKMSSPRQKQPRSPFLNFHGPSGPCFSACCRCVHLSCLQYKYWNMLVVQLLFSTENSGIVRNRFICSLRQHKSLFKRTATWNCVGCWFIKTAVPKQILHLVEELTWAFATK